MDWFELLKQMKLNSGMTTMEISVKANVPEPTLEKLFSGHTKDPKLSTIRAVVHCLGKTLDDLAPLCNAKKAPSSEDEDGLKVQLMENYDRMNEAGQCELLKHSQLLLESNQYKKCAQSGLVEGIA